MTLRAIDICAGAGGLCKLCEKRLRSDNRSGYCRAHTPRGGEHSYGACSSCSRRLGKDNASGLCRACNASRVGTASTAQQTGAANPAWKGGRHVDERGYVRVRIDGRYRREHRVVAERELGRQLTSSEVVHHRDENPANNAPENLEVYSSNADHMRAHAEIRKKGAA